MLGLSGLGGDFSHLHVVEEYARRAGHPSRFAHGQLTAVVSMGIHASAQVFRHAVALLEERHRYLAPVYVGDTISAELEVSETRLTRSPADGRVRFRDVVRNRSGTVVCESEYAFLIDRRPSGQDAAA